MKACGEANKTRIDTVLVNQLAAAMIKKVDFNWNLYRKYDHARLVVEFDVGVAMQKVSRLMPVIPLNLDKFWFDPGENASKEDIRWFQEQACKSFIEHWRKYEDEFQKHISERNVDAAHEVWFSAAETWLFIN